MFEWLTDHWRHRRALAEIAAMTEAVLADASLTRAQLHTLVRLPKEVVTRMTSMARIFGLSEERISGNRAEYVELLTRCASCYALWECELELAKGTNADPWGCAFCMNSGRFAEMANAS